MRNRPPPQQRGRGVRVAQAAMDLVRSKVLAAAVGLSSPAVAGSSAGAGEGPADAPMSRLVQLQALLLSLAHTYLSRIGSSEDRRRYLQEACRILASRGATAEGLQVGNCRGHGGQGWMGLMHNTLSHGHDPLSHGLVHGH